MPPRGCAAARDGMAVPRDRILFVEPVGPQSEIAKLIAEAKTKR